MYSVLTCHNVAKYTELHWDSYGPMWLPLAMQGVSKRVLQWYSKCCCVASVTKTFILKGIQITHRSSPWTVTNPGKIRCVLLHYDSSKHCTCSLNKFIEAFKVVKLFLKHLYVEIRRRYCVILIMTCFELRKLLWPVSLYLPWEYEGIHELEKKIVIDWIAEDLLGSVGVLSGLLSGSMQGQEHKLT
jgi:hypothetical protein